jgi:hypothetical protein
MSAKYFCLTGLVRGLQIDLDESIDHIKAKI